MKITHQILITIVLTFSCLVGINTSMQRADASEPLPTEAHFRLAQFGGSRVHKFELPEGIEDILNPDPAWPPMPMKRRTLPANPVTGGPIVEGLQLFAQLEKYQVEVLEPIVFRITVRNTTNKELEFGATNVNEKDFIAEVKDRASQGNRMRKFLCKFYSTNLQLSFLLLVVQL